MADKITIDVHPAGMPVAPVGIEVNKGAKISDIVVDLNEGTLPEGVTVWYPGKGTQLVQLPQEQWGRVRVKKSGVFRVEYNPHNGLKNVFATVAAIALAIAAPYLFGALVPILGTTLAGIATGAILGGASIALQQLFPPEAAVGVGGGAEAASAKYRDVTTDSNVLGKFGYLPVVIGEGRRLLPPDIMNPHTLHFQNITRLHRMVALEGHHALDELKMDGTSLEDLAPHIQHEQFSGAPEVSQASSLITRVAYTKVINTAFSYFSLEAADRDIADASTETPERAAPLYHYFSTPAHDDLDEIVIRIRVDQAYYTANTDDNVVVPFRLQFRPTGATTWWSFREMHLRGRWVAPEIFEFRIRWDDNWTDGAKADSNRFYTYATTQPIVNSDDYVVIIDEQENTGDIWAASGENSPTEITYSSRSDGIRLRLEESAFPKSGFEFRMKRGLQVRDGDMQGEGTSEYTVNGGETGDNWSLFWPLGDYDYEDGVWDVAEVPVSNKKHPSRVTLLQVCALAAADPVQRPGTCAIAYRSEGHGMQGLTAKAAKYVHTYQSGDGSPSGAAGWNYYVPNSANPAAHYRAFLVQYMKQFGISRKVINDESLVAWYQECEARGYKVSAVFSGESIGEVLSTIATAGFAAPYFSDKFGVNYFKDRSSELPVQVFSNRNTSDISFAIEAYNRPTGYRVKFDNKDDDWKQDEVYVSLNNAQDLAVYEAQEYKGIDDVELVKRRAYFDLLQLSERKRSWTVKTGLEGIVCEVGDIVSVITDLFDDEHHGARVLEVISSTTLRLDQDFPELTTTDPEFGASPSIVTTISTLLEVGKNTVLTITTPSGVEQHNVKRLLEDGSGRQLVELFTSLADTDIVGAHANLTPNTNKHHRCIVVGVQRGEDDQATLTLVDEAPQIWTKMQERFG